MSITRKIVSSYLIVLGLGALSMLFVTGCAPAPQQTKETPKISSIAYTHQEAEVGDQTLYVISRTTGDNVSLNLRSYPEASDGHGGNETFDVGSAALDNVEKICASYGIFDWPAKAEAPETVTLDAEEFIFDITLEDGSSISFSNLDKLPDGGKQAVDELSSYIESLIDVEE